MDIEKLKMDVWKANMDLQRHGLITLTWGNVSGIDREEGLLAIKPSGVPYDELTPEKIAIVSLQDGKTLKNSTKPSSDTPTHLELYRNFPELGGVVHTHSTHATSFAQACKGIPCLGTTHADAFYGEIPATRSLSKNEIEGDYERNTGLVIIETMKKILAGESALHMPGILVSQHGPFTWGKSPEHAVENAIVLEEVAKMALLTYAANPSIQPIPQTLLDKHFLRKHGKNAYYGQ